ncbi:MAG: hypothetical protein ACE5F8_03535, partial [Woeseiaceae bacterium]
VMIYFAHQLDPDRLHQLLDDRVSEFRDATAHIEDIRNSWPADAPAGARFVAGFGQAMAEAAARYIEENRHLLGTAPSASAKQPRDARHRLAATLEERP